MPNVTTHSPHAATLDISRADSALCAVLVRLLEPIARLSLAFGITFAKVEEVLKRVFVQEAVALHPETPSHGLVSRISTATGINRREVTRLTAAASAERTVRQPVSAELIARWVTDNAYCEQGGTPRTLRRQGPAPSFESLAKTITRDVHFRSILEELTRLGLVAYNGDDDSVTLTSTDFTPHDDAVQLLELLGNNVGDHLVAAVANVTGNGPKHLEQAVFADELSEESAAVLKPIITAHWQALRNELVPAITALIEEDRRAGRNQDQRVRVGLYSFAETAPVCESKPRRVRGVRRLSTAAKEETQP